jgi:hypothetical protein
VVHGSGATEHFEWLAEGSGDPRPEMARRVIEACVRARTVIAYNSPFERECLRTMAAGSPEHKDALAAIERKLFDALPLVRENVYHPGFAGSFGLKSVYPALMGKNEYGDLEIADGELASVRLSTLLFAPETLTAPERATLREQLRRYCALDTLALAELVEHLREMAGVEIKYGQLELLALAPSSVAEVRAPAGAHRPSTRRKARATNASRLAPIAVTAP